MPPTLHVTPPAALHPARSCRPTPALALACAAVLCTPAAAQVADTCEGPAEFVGLSRTTAAELDRVVVDRCAGHYCAATLEGTCGFADAAVFVLPQGGGVRKLIVLVEDADRVRRKRLLPGTSAMPDDWGGFCAGFDADGAAFHLAVRHYPQRQHDGEAAARAALEAIDWAAPELPAVDACWRFLAAHAAVADRTTALWLLDHDPDPAARRLAAAVLLNFADDDVVWWALADGMRDPEDRVSGTCWSALRALAEHRPRPVDWRPAAPALAALLAGTHCFGLPDLCRALVATEVDPALAPVLMAVDGGELLLGLAAAQASFARERARELLTRLTALPAEAEVPEFRAAVARILDAGAPAPPAGGAPDKGP